MYYIRGRLVERSEFIVHASFTSALVLFLLRGDEDVTRQALRRALERFDRFETKNYRQLMAGDKT